MSPAAPNAIDMDAAFIWLRRDIEYQIFKIVACRDTAADLATELYLKLKRVSPLCRTEAEAWSYLHKMAKSAAIDHVRTARRRRELLAEFPLEEARSPNPEAIASARREAEIVQAAMSELPERTQDMLYMSRMLGMSYGEIAAEFGVSRSLTEKVVAEGLLHCRTRLREVAEWEAARETMPLREAVPPARGVMGRLREKIQARLS